MLTNGITATLNSSQLREQAGFRGGYLTIDYIRAINQVIEKYVEYAKPLCMAFIDYEQSLWLSENLSIYESSQETGDWGGREESIMD